MNRNQWSDAEDDAAAEDGTNEQDADLQNLQRHYRRLCGDRKSFMKGTQNVIRRQYALIESLTNENAETTTDLENTNSLQNQNKDAELTEKLEQLLGQNDDYLDEILEEKERIGELDEEIRRCELEERKKHQKMGGVARLQLYQSAIQKQMRVLENRLHKAQLSFSSQLTHNRELRKQIDHLRKERTCFDSIHKKLTKELDDTKAEMTQVIESATSAYEQRDEFQNKMLQMQERNERDQSQFSSEMKELERIISHDEKLKQFMNIKAQDRAEYKEEEAAKKRRAGGNGDKHLDHDRMLITDYETAFQRIKEITGQDDLNVIVNDFIKKEDDNFALFNYVNELSTNNEFLTEQCETIRNGMQKFEEETTKLEGARNIKMTELQAKLDHANQLAAEEKERLREGQKSLEEIKRGVRDLFDKIECDEKPVYDLLGSTDGIRDNNIMVYLGLIEQRTNELLAIQHYLHAKENEPKERTMTPKDKRKDEEPTQAMVKPLPPHHFSNIVPPCTMDELDDEPSSDEDEKPLSRSEIKQKMQKQSHMKLPIQPQQPAEQQQQQQHQHPIQKPPSTVNQQTAGSKSKEGKKKKSTV